MECVDWKLSTLRSKHLAHSRETLISHVTSGVKCVIFGSENTVTGTLGIAQRSGGGGRNELLLGQNKWAQTELHSRLSFSSSTL